MGEFSAGHIFLVLVIFIVLFGPSRLPGLGHSMGKAIKGFKDGLKNMNDESSAPPPSQAQNQFLTPGQAERDAEKLKNDEKNRT